MQLDMHYYGTYAMARAAGLTADVSKIIASCAQFVDDNAARSHVTFRNGSRIDVEATAHHTVDGANLDEGDQRQVWVPFHFLPGNIGDSYTERLKCRMDSEIAQEMRDHHLALADRAFAPALIGIAAHVYADTFAHYGFSGVSSRGNKVDNGSFKFHADVDGVDGTIAELTPEMQTYIQGKADAFFAREGEHGGLRANIMSWLGENLSGALGHGSVATYPDRPYLVWSFDYEREDAVINGIDSARSNPVTFFRGCRALHEMFRRFAMARRDDYGSGQHRSFDDIATRVFSVLAVQGDKETRIQAWQDAAREGTVFGEPGEQIPEYEGASWNDQWREFDEQENYTAAMASPIWHFYQAASLHRNYVLRDLLPKHGLIVA